MPLIKRYPNRKLYDTAAKQYVSLDGVAELIRNGEAVRVVDHATGEDLTTLMLVQIIVEQEKQHSGFLPLAVLTGMVQAGGHTLATLRRSLSAPLDLVKHVDEEIQARVERLVSLGELAEDEGKRLVRSLLASGAGAMSASAPTEEQLAQMLASRGLPTRDAVAHLSELINSLEAEVDRLALEEARTARAPSG